jgi:hypothetical protein
MKYHLKNFLIHYIFFQVILIPISIQPNQNAFTRPTLKYRQIWVELYCRLDICRVTMNAYVEPPCMNLKDRLDLCKGFGVEVYVLVDYVAALLGCWCPKFREGGSGLVCTGPVSSATQWRDAISPKAKPSAAPLWKPKILQRFMRLTNLHNISLNLSSILTL